MTALRQAIDRGVNFIDTADVYGNGRSERLIAQLKRSAKKRLLWRPRQDVACRGRPSTATAARISSRG